MNTLNRISKYCFWTDAYKKRKEAKWRVGFYKSLDYEVILKKWEHNSWGDSIYCTKGGGFYGCISNVRPLKGFTMRYCDLKSGDILIYEVDKDMRHLSNGCKYDVGCLVNIQKPGNPYDMFFADFVRICFTDDISDIRKLVSNEIEKWQKYI